MWLVGGFKHFFPFHIWDVILPIDFHIFQRGRLNHQPGGLVFYFDFLMLLAFLAGTKSSADAGGENLPFTGDAAYHASAVGHVPAGAQQRCTRHVRDKDCGWNLMLVRLSLKL